MDIGKLMRATFYNPFKVKTETPKPSQDLVKELLERAKASGVNLLDREALRKFVKENAGVTTSIITGNPYGYKLKPKTKTTLILP